MCPSSVCVVATFPGTVLFPLLYSLLLFFSLTHGPINVRSPNNTSKWQMGFNSVFKGLSENCNYNKLSRVISKVRLLRKIYANDISNADQFRNCCTVAVVRGPKW